MNTSQIAGVVIVILVGAVTVPAIATADDDQNNILVPDLSATQEGDLPAGWEGPDSLVVRKDGDKAWIEASSAGIHELKSPKFDVSEDFKIEMSIELTKGTNAKGSEVRILCDASSGESMKLSFEQSNPALGFEQWRITFGDSSKVIKAALDEPVSIQLIRQGRIFKVNVDGKAVIARRMSQFKSFSRMRVSVSGPETDQGLRVARVHSISFTRSSSE